MSTLLGLKGQCKVGKLHNRNLKAVLLQAKLALFTTLQLHLRLIDLSKSGFHSDLCANINRLNQIRLLNNRKVVGHPSSFLRLISNENLHSLVEIRI